MVDNVPVGRRALALLSLRTALGMAVLDAVMLVVALPTIAADLRVAPSDVLWAVSSYQVAALMLSLPIARLAEHVGARRLFLGGVALFSAGATFGAVAPSLPLLALARLVQGVAVAAVIGLNGGLLRTVEKPDALGRTLAVNAAVISSAAALAPLIGGLLVAQVGWRALLLASLPFAAVALGAGHAAIPDPPCSPHRPAFGAMTLGAAGLGLLGFGLTGFAQGMAATAASGLVASGVVALALAIRSEAGLASPLLPVDLLADRGLRYSYATSLAAYAAELATLASAPFLLVRIHEFPAISAALAMSAWPAAAGLASPGATRLAERHGVSLVGAVGLATTAVTMLLLAMIPASVPDWLPPALLAAAGIGFAAFQTPNAKAILLAAPIRRAASASAMQATARLTGQTLAAALVAALATRGDGWPLLGAALLAALAALASSRRGPP